MSKFVTPKTSFKAGLISPRLHGRVDIREYQEALSVSSNAFTGKSGGAFKRFGTSAFGSLGELTTAPALRSVVMFSNRTLFMIFTTQDVIFVDETGNWISGFIQLSPTFSLNPNEYNFAMFENTVIITHYSGKIEPKYFDFEIADNGKLKFTSKIFNINTVDYRGRPIARGDRSIKMTVNNVDNPSAAQLISSAAYFTSDMVGEYIKLVGTHKVQKSDRLGSNFYRITSFVNSTTVNVTPQFTFTYDDAVPMIPDVFDVISNMLYDGSLGRYIVDGSQSEEFGEWYHTAWSDRLGWPKTVAVDEARVVFGGSDTYPATVWGSKTNDKFFFLDQRNENGSFSWRLGSTVANNETFGVPYSGDIRDTDPYNFTLASNNGATITFMSSSVNFVVGANNQEFLISGNGQAISQKNISARPHTSHGSKPILPVVYDNVVIFANRSGDILHMFLYNESNGSYITKEISILNEDIFTAPIRSMAWHEELSSVFICLEDGNLITLTINNETQTTAFGQHTFQRVNISTRVEGVAYAVDSSTNRDFMVLLINRSNASGSNYFLERLDRYPVDVLSLPLFEKIDNLSHIDRQRSYKTFRPPQFFTFIDINEDYIQTDPSTYEIGDTVEFYDADGGDPLSGIGGISYGVTYYVIPYKAGLNTYEAGIRLATSLANAQSNTYIDITGSGSISVTAEARLGGSVANNMVDFPMDGIRDGESYYIYYVDTFGSLTEELRVHDGSSKITLPSGMTEVIYGMPIKFHIATVPIEAGGDRGSSQLGLTRIDRASTRVYKTRSYQIGTDGYNMEDRTFDEAYTGTDQVAVTASPEFDQVVHIINDKPEPCYIASMALRGVSNDG